MADKSAWEVDVTRVAQLAAVVIMLWPAGGWAQSKDQTDFKFISEQKLERLTENIFDAGPGDIERQIAWPTWRGYHTIACNGNGLLVGGGTVGGRLPKPVGS